MATGTTDGLRFAREATRRIAWTRAGKDRYDSSCLSPMNTRLLKPDAQVFRLRTWCVVGCSAHKKPQQGDPVLAQGERREGN